MSSWENALLIVFQIFLYALIVFVGFVCWYLLTHLFTFFFFWKNLKGLKLMLWLFIGLLWPLVSILAFAVYK